VVTAFEKATGYTVKLDAPPETAKVKAMVQSGNVSWDVIMTDAPAIQAMLKDSLLEPIDYAAVDKARLARIPKELQQQYALGQRIYSFNIVYNTNLMPKAKHTRNWAEVWTPELRRARLLRGGTARNSKQRCSLTACRWTNSIRSTSACREDDGRASRWLQCYVSCRRSTLSAGEVVVNTVGSRGIAAKSRAPSTSTTISKHRQRVPGGRACDKVAIVHQYRLDPKLQALIAQRSCGPSNSGAFGFCRRRAADWRHRQRTNQFWSLRIGGRWQRLMRRATNVCEADDDELTALRIVVR
jgi:putative spermidine/putrescine transport system substrate-binding protein